MKLSNFAFLPPMDDIKKDLIQRLKKDFPHLSDLEKADKLNKLSKKL